METKISFKPLKGGKFRCYLDGKITNIVTRNCESVRNRLYNQHKPFRVKPIATEPIPSAIADWRNYWECPNLDCGEININGHIGETKNCFGCGKPVKITGVKLRPQRPAFSLW